MAGAASWPLAKSILRLGNPLLRKTAEKFTSEEIMSPGAKQLVNDLKKQMKLSHGVGIAAPQLGISKSLMLVEVEPSGPQKMSLPLTAFFNPELEFLMKHEIIYMWESCLSVPTLVGKVPRYNNVIVHYLDENAKPKRVAANGYMAGILQHEADHLSGKLFIDRVQNTKDLGYNEEWARYMAEEPGICWTGTAKFYEGV